MAYIRKFKTSSGATGVQVCYKRGNIVEKTIHVGSASEPKAVEKLVKKARALIEQEQGTITLFDLKKYEK